MAIRLRLLECLLSLKLLGQYLRAARCGYEAQVAWRWVERSRAEFWVRLHTAVVWMFRSCIIQNVSQSIGGLQDKSTYEAVQQLAYVLPVRLVQ